MGHTIGKDVYRKLGKKIDNLTMRAPWNETLHAILKELYSPEEAEIIVRMPFGLSTLDKIAAVTGYKTEELHRLLEGLCEKGLVLDLFHEGSYHYAISPLVIGIFEFTMMRTGDNLNSREWARLFHEYMLGDDSFLRSNCENGEKISVLRALPHEGSIKASEYVEVLDYEKASAIVDTWNVFAIGICSCRHEQLHLDKKECDIPLDTCTSFGPAAEFVIRRNLGRAVSKSEILDTIERSKESGLALSADNVQKKVTFICHCCKCCCNIMLGINTFGYTNILVTSNYYAEVDETSCIGCGKCATVCPVNVITMRASQGTASRPKPEVNTALCLGCGVCAVKCPTGSIKLTHRQQRVIHPEDTFERILLQCIEKGTLQNFIFDNPQKMSHKIMRGVVGGFLRLPPVKKSIMSDTLRSRFLNQMRARAAKQGMERMLEM